MATTNSIQVFNSPQFGQVRTTGTSENPLFCLADVCRVLGLRQGDVRQRLTEGVVSTQPLSTAGGIQQVNFVNEDGLYDVILDSRKPEAKQFRKWVTSEVLPSIRKTGGYIASSAEDTPEEIMARAFIIAQDTIKRKDERIALQQQTINEQQSVIDRQAPDVAFAQTIKASGTNILIGDFYPGGHRGCKSEAASAILYAQDKSCYGQFAIIKNPVFTACPSFVLNPIRQLLDNTPVYNNIENFLWSIKQEPISEPDNKTKILNHGFDLKTSFRKM